MNTLYIDCRMGVSGAKLLGALVDILDNPDLFIYNFNKLGIEGIVIQRIPDAMKGITGSSIEFRRKSSSDSDPYADEIDDEDRTEYEPIRRVKRTLDDVKRFINKIKVDDEVKNKAIEIYTNIARAAAKATDNDVEYITMKKTGSRDVIAAIVGVCLAIDELSPERIISSSVAVGEGYARTSRGRLPIPTPEMQLVLGDTPYINGTEKSELASLDGAALIAYFADEFGGMPEMTVRKSGAGFGRRSFRSGVNCVKASIGEAASCTQGEITSQLCTELFDVSESEISELGRTLCELGAEFVYTTDIKDFKGNSGLLLNCVCKNSQSIIIADEILKRTDAQSVRKVSESVYLK